MSVLDTMKGATALVRRVTLCLDGALQDEYDAETAKLADASFADRDSLAAENTTAVVDRMETLREKMLAAEVTFSFKALPWFRRLALQGEHPARDGNVGDRASGHNNDTYTTALIRESCASVQGVDGVVVTDIPDDVWDAMLGEINFSQVDVLFTTAQNANDAATTVPPSARSLLASQDLGASSKSPGPGTSPRAGSVGGNRPRQRKSSTTTKAGSAAS